MQVAAGGKVAPKSKVVNDKASLLAAKEKKKMLKSTHIKRPPSAFNLYVQDKIAGKKDLPVTERLKVGAATTYVCSAQLQTTSQKCCPPAKFKACIVSGKPSRACFPHSQVLESELQSSWVSWAKDPEYTCTLHWLYVFHLHCSLAPGFHPVIALFFRTQCQCR